MSGVSDFLNHLVVVVWTMVFFFFSSRGGGVKNQRYQVNGLVSSNLIGLKTPIKPTISEFGTSGPWIDSSKTTSF